jgi:hypothetical protein
MEMEEEIEKEIEKENGYVQTSAPKGAMFIKRWDSLCEQARRLPHLFINTPLVSTLSMTKIASRKIARSA